MNVSFAAPTLQAGWSPRHGHTVVRFRDRFWLYGGCEEQSEDPAAIRGDIWSSADGAEWRREAASAAWPDRYLQEMVVYRGRIWMFGGMHRYRPERVNLNDVWCSDDGVSWRQVTAAAPWPPRHVFTAAVHDSRMWVGCGAPDGEVYYDDLWWSTDGADWHRCPADGARFSVRKSPALVSFRGALWIIGGMELVRPGVCAAVNDVWRSVDGCAWTRVTARRSGRRGISPR